MLTNEELEYIESIPLEKIFHIKKWDPQILSIATDLEKKISSVAPELEVLFMGSAALRLPGMNDIDLDILCYIDDLDKYKQKLKSIFGDPTKIETKSIWWEFKVNGIDIEIILSDPNTSHVPVQKRMFELLKNDKSLIEKYRKLKVDSDNKPYRDYVRKKIEFFHSALDVEQKKP